ncbi:unnamed protein product [Mytilus coruscus]|uniref:Uncharacterized protein n=1 Tax=Mytilus coruscus TaxID=42192 RepID=A0A6J8F089_MYTCO|nr:unnamed protein product [Mytilus coruscus]
MLVVWIYVIFSFNFFLSDINKTKEANKRKRFDYLLKQTELFSHFIQTGAKEEDEQGTSTSKGRRSKGKAGRHRLKEKDEDKILLDDCKAEKDIEIFDKSPSLSAGDECVHSTFMFPRMTFKVPSLDETLTQSMFREENIYPSGWEWHLNGSSKQNQCW